MAFLEAPSGVEYSRQRLSRQRADGGALGWPGAQDGAWPNGKDRLRWAACSRRKAQRCAFFSALIIIGPVVLINGPRRVKATAPSAEDEKLELYRKPVVITDKSAPGLGAPFYLRFPPFFLRTLIHLASY